MEKNATVLGLLAWQEEGEVMYASQVGSSIRKRLTCTCMGKFKVYDHDECIYHGDDPYLAIEKYNSIRKTNG